MKLLNSLTLVLFSLSARTVLGGGGTAASDETSAADAHKAGSLRRGLGAPHCDVYKPLIGCQCKSGIYCGGNEESTGIDAAEFQPNTLYDCDEGCYTVREVCGDDKICSFEPCTQDDFCKSVPPPTPPSAKPSASPSSSPTPSPTDSPTESPSSSPSLSDYDCDDKKNIGRKCTVTLGTPGASGATGVCVKEGGFPNDASDKHDDRCCPTSIGFTVCSKSSGSKGSTDCCTTAEKCDYHTGECYSPVP